MSYDPAMPASFRLSCEDWGRPANLSVFECETLDELADELHLALAGVEDVFRVDLRPSPSPPFSVPQAMEVLVGELERLTTQLEVRCLVTNERARSMLVRCLPPGQRPRLEGHCGATEIHLECGDITAVRADVLLNASNTRLELGGGVSGAIRSATREPEALQAAMYSLAPLEQGQAVLTPSYGLATPWLIHVATASGERTAVEVGLRAALRLCAEHDFEVLALPALGAGTGGLSNEASARVILGEVSRARAACPRLIKVMLYDKDSFDSFASVLVGGSGKLRASS